MSDIKTYKFIIAGAGLGGLSFLHHLIKKGLADDEILILDSDSKKSNDRTWSFWSEEQPEYLCARENKWQTLGFASDDFTRYDDISPYSYYSIQGIDFYNEVLEELKAKPNIEFKNERIKKIDQSNNLCIVETERGVFHSEYLIDSVSRPDISSDDYYLNFQQFLGWFIKCEEDVFDPQKPILMDFRTEQQSAVSFIYLLPFSKNSALIEYTQFSPQKDLSRKYFRDKLRTYISEILEIQDFQLQKEEIGFIPMSNYPFEERPSSRIFRVGTAGGDTKGSTGYTFSFVQKHVKAIIEELSGNGSFKRENLKFRFYDNLLLKIINEEPEKVKDIMTALFRDQPISRILKFLDEESNLIEDALIFRSLPWFPFIRALFQNQINASSV